MNSNLNVATSFAGVGSNSQSPRPSTTGGLPRDPFLPMLTNTSWKFDGGDDIAAEAAKNWKSASKISSQLLAPVNSSVAQLKSPITLYDNQEPSSTKRGRKRRDPWSKEEDITLLALLKLEDKQKPNWPQLAKKMKLCPRTGKQCRERWQNHLRPNIKKGNWTKQEEHMIKSMYNAFGPKWSCMAKLLPNRTDNDIKNKWNSMLRSKRGKQKRAEQVVQETLEKNVVASAVARSMKGKTIPVAPSSHAALLQTKPPPRSHSAGVATGVASYGAIYHGTDEPNCGDENDTTDGQFDSAEENMLPNGSPNSIQNCAEPI